MDKTASILAALDAGKLPSQQQINAYLGWLLKSALTQVEPITESEGGELSAEGKAIIGDLRELLTAYKLVGEHKNEDNLIQEALWHLYQADLPSSGIQASREEDVDQASKDARALARSIKSLLRIVWTNFTNESGSVFHDFASFMRLAIADAAEFISKSAGSAAEGLRDVDAEIEKGDRNELGIPRSNQNAPAKKDAKVQFERAMDTAKLAGSKAIGAGQVAVATTEGLANRASERVQEAFFKICDRAQDNEEYHSSVATIFDILHKWIHKSLDTAGDINTDTSLEAFVDDSTEEKHLIEAIRGLRTFLERLAGGKSVDDFFAVLRICGVDIQRDENLRVFFDDLLAHLRRSIDQRGYVRSEEAQEQREGLKARWKGLYDADSDEGQKWRADVAKLRNEAQEFQKALEGGQDTKRIRKAQVKLAKVLEGALTSAASTGAQIASDKTTWLWQDLFNAYIPRLLSIVKDIPIPRIEYEDEEVEFVLEDLDVSSFSLLPGHAYIRNITDIDIKATVAGETSTAVGSLTRVYIQALQLSLREVSFYYKDKTSNVGPSEYTGLLEFTLPPQGIDVDVVVRMIPNSPEGLKERQRVGGFQEIQRVEVKVSEGVDLQVKQSNHSILATLFRPIMLSRFRDTLQTILADNIRAALEWGDNFAWDVGNRAEVFADAGLSRGPSIIAGFWSELGHLKKGRVGLLKGWKATGTGLIKDEGNIKPGSKFALGAEPQVLSGEKRGPKGTFSQSIAADVLGVDTTAEEFAEGAGEAFRGVTTSVKEQVKEGVRKVKTFNNAVIDKVDQEKSRSGWRSSAFDI